MKIYNVMQYGAKGDGKTNDAFSIQHAIDDCAKNGGGQVVLPSGYTFYSDSIRLKKNVDFHIQKGATIKAKNTNFMLTLILIRIMPISQYLTISKKCRANMTCMILHQAATVLSQIITQY